MSLNPVNAGSTLRDRLAVLACRLCGIRPTALALPAPGQATVTLAGGLGVQMTHVHYKGAAPATSGGRVTGRFVVPQRSAAKQP